MNNIIKKTLNGQLDRLFDTLRWNSSHFVFQKESLSDHQYMVTYLANSICIDLNLSPDSRLKVLEYALHHDWDEIFTGDIGHTVKYNQHNGKDIRDSLELFINIKCEEQFNEDESEIAIAKILTGKHGYPIFVKKLVKVCDWISMLFFCIRELKLGNQYFFDKYDYCKQSCLRSIDEFEEMLEMELQEDSSICLDFELNEQLFIDLKQAINLA